MTLQIANIHCEYNPCPALSLMKESFEALIEMTQINGRIIHFLRSAESLMSEDCRFLYSCLSLMSFSVVDLNRKALLIGSALNLSIDWQSLHMNILRIFRFLVQILAKPSNNLLFMLWDDVDGPNWPNYPQCPIRSCRSSNGQNLRNL